MQVETKFSGIVSLQQLLTVLRSSDELSELAWDCHDDSTTNTAPSTNILSL